MYEMSFSEIYDNFSEEDKNCFQSAVTRLLNCTYINRHKIDMTQWDDDYVFIQRNLDTVEKYFAYAGYEVTLYPSIEVISLTSKFKFARKSLDKETSLFALALRQIYVEEQGKLASNDFVAIRNSDFLDKLFEYGIRNKKPNLQQMAKILRYFSNIGIIRKIKGRWEDLDTSFIIYPSIFLLLPEERIDKCLDYFEKRNEEKLLND